MINDAIDTQSFRTVALDSSILAELSRKYFKNELNRIEIREFLSSLYESGYIPFLTTQHLVELIKHKNDQVVAERLEFLESLPMISWINSDDKRLGNIKDIHILELNAFLRTSDTSIFDIRDLVKKDFLKVNPANTVIRKDISWVRHRKLAWHEEAEQRKMVAANLYNPKNINEMPLKKLFGSVIDFGKSFEDAIEEISNGMSAAAVRGDRRLKNSAFFGEYYLKRVNGKKIIAEASGITFEEYIRRCGINPASLDPDDSVLDLAIRLEFIERLKHIQEWLIVDFQTAKERIFPDSIPSWLSEKSLKKFRQQRKRHEGSEINDHHLAALSIYCDLTYVDKRTSEDLKRAFANTKDFTQLANRVEKVTSLDRILQQLHAAHE